MIVPSTARMSSAAPARLPMSFRAPSLWAPFDRNVARRDLLVTCERRRYATWSWDDWRTRALRIAAGLGHAGVQRGDRVGLLLTNSFEACAAVLGVWLAGGCAVSLPLIARGMTPGGYIEQLRRIISEARLHSLIVEEATHSIPAGADVGATVSAVRSVTADVEAQGEPPNACDEIFVQYSSGSISEPKGCALSASAIAYQLSALEQALEIDPELDTGVVWLPLSHDMGLLGCLLLTYWTGHRLVLGSPERFLSNPGSWFEDCARFGATVSAAPSFALELAAAAARVRMPPPCPMRRLIVGGEPVEPDTLEAVTSVMGPERLPRASVTPAYGMAEAALAVTMARLDEPARVLHVEREALADGEVRPAVRGPADRDTVGLVSVGRPLPGMGVSVAGEGATRVGEISVKSPSRAIPRSCG